MRHRYAFRRCFRALLPVLIVLAASVSLTRTAVCAAPGEQYVGLWDRRGSQSVRSVIRLKADGTWSDGLDATGKWAVEGNQLMVRYDDHPNWLDRYTLPMQGEVLRGRDAAGGGESMTRRSPEATAPFAGEWEFFNPDDGKRAKDSLSPEGTWSENGHPIGFWQVAGDMLILNFKALGWVDTYYLPVKGDVLHGQNRGGVHITLARNGAKPGEPPVKAPPEALTGTWNFSNAGDGKRALQVLNKDGRFLENGKPQGFWSVMGDQLVFTYQEGELGEKNWKDTYYLPPETGVLRGTNRNGSKLTLARSGVVVPPETVEQKPIPVADTPTAGTTRTKPAVDSSIKAGSAGDSQYFGKRSSGPTAPGAPAGPMPAPTASVTAVETPATTPASTPAIVLTPVGDWHWHSSILYTLTEKGAVKEGAKVAGQWKWLDKEKGEIQIQWNLIPARPPENYSLSAHGNHLTWKNAPQGNVFTEDRVN